MSHLAGRRVPQVLLLAALVLGGTLSACGENPGDTTCGELEAMSAAERRDLIRDGVADSDDADTEAALEAASDDDLDQVAAFVMTACAAVDDDTLLDDLGE